MNERLVLYCPLRHLVLSAALSGLVSALTPSDTLAGGTTVDPSPVDHAAGNLAPPSRRIPSPLPDHPGNVYLDGEDVRIAVPQGVPAPPLSWRALDDRLSLVKSGVLTAPPVDGRPPTLELGRLGVGWYRVEFGPPEAPTPVFTTAAVVARLKAPTPAHSPISVDSASAWFARDDREQQRRLANLASLAGVNWVRDRLRWADLQPTDGPLKPGSTTYDTSADAQHEAGLNVLQVFHDTPSWARGPSGQSGQFAPDLRHLYRFTCELARRFQGRVQAWEPWNEANVASFGAHTVDQMCSWQKAAWLGFKAGDPTVLVGWNATAAVPTPAHTEGLLANRVWPYFDTYNIHTYDWSHGYLTLWKPARDALAGRPLWITEADRGVPHLKNPPWFDLDPHHERLKAEWIAQSYASSLFAGAQRHFHFILGQYHEPQGVQFGLLRLDLTPRMPYVALAAVGRCLAGARTLGRWRPGHDVNVYAFRASPDGTEHDMLVLWAEKEVDWSGRGQSTADWRLPPTLQVDHVMDYLGRPLGRDLPAPLTSAPVFVSLPAGQAKTLPLEPPPPPETWRGDAPSSLVLQMSASREVTCKVEDLQWSEAYAYRATEGVPLELKLHVYNFSAERTQGDIEAARHPPGWTVSLQPSGYSTTPMERHTLAATVLIPDRAQVRDGWIILEARNHLGRQATLAFRVVAPSSPP